jgi:hypothetical protein
VGSLKLLFLEHLQTEAFEEHGELGEDAVNEGENLESESRRKIKHRGFLSIGRIQTGLFEFISA